MIGLFLLAAQHFWEVRDMNFSVFSESLFSDPSMMQHGIRVIRSLSCLTPLPSSFSKQPKQRCWILLNAAERCWTIYEATLLNSPSTPVSSKLKISFAACWSRIPPKQRGTIHRDDLRPQSELLRESCDKRYLDDFRRFRKRYLTLEKNSMTSANLFRLTSVKWQYLSISVFHTAECSGNPMFR